MTRRQDIDAGVHPALVAADHIIVRDGLTLLDLTDVLYVVSPLESLDENLRTCRAEDRDVLLDARLLLYPR